MKSLIKSRKAKYGGAALLLSILVLAAVIILNVIVGVLASRYEWMYANMNSTAVYDISENCEEYLAEHVFSRVDEVNKKNASEGKAAQKIKIVFCDDKKSIEQEQAQKYILDAVYEIDELFPGYIEIDYINIWEQPSIAREYGVSAESDVVCIFDGRYETMSLTDFYIYSIADSSAPTGYNGEKIISSCLMRVTQENTPTCYFTANHGEAFDDYEFMRTIVEAGYAAEFIDLSSEDIPEDCDLLVTFEPKQDLLISDGTSKISEVDKLNAYMNKGGKYMVFLSADTFASGARENLEGFLKDWGITYMHEKAPGEGGVENCYLIKDSANSLTVDGYTILSESVKVGPGAKVMSSLSRKNAFRNATCIGYAEEFLPLPGGIGERTATVNGKERTVFPLMQSYSTAEAWAGGRAVARASENPFALMTMTTQACEGGKTAYLVASASTDFATEEFMQSIALGNNGTLMGIISYMGKENAPVELSYKPFSSTSITALTVKDANTVTVLLTVIPALASLILGAIVLIRRKNS